ncbi:MAG: CARDB domain-containing protein [Phototrophicaceae bacterium]
MKNLHLPPQRFTLVIVFVLFAVLTAPYRGLAQAPSFKIGVIGTADDPISRGATLLVNQINRSGGVEGADGTLFQLELVFVPLAASDPLTVLEALQAEGVIAVIGLESITDFQAATALVEGLTVPLLTPIADDTLFIITENPLVYRLTASEFLRQRALAEYLTETEGFTNIALYQFDALSTVQALGFINAIDTVGVNISPPEIVTNSNRDAQIAQILARKPQVVITYGDPAAASGFYFELLASGYVGAFAHPDAGLASFQGEIPKTLLTGIYGTSNWSYTATDLTSDQFTQQYIATYGDVPAPLVASGADAISLLQAAIQLPGELRSNLPMLTGVTGVQGILSPANLSPGELADNVAVVQLNDFGIPQVVARFSGSTPLPLGEPDVPLITATPTPTATPQGVVATVISAVQNVRTGPGTAYPTIGQLAEGEQIRIIGANRDFTWLVIEYRGQQGWIANLPNLNEVFGDLSTLPVITPPSPPTPVATNTPAPPQDPDLIVQTASISPNPILPNSEFTLSVTVSNVGRSAAGTFAVASTLPPNNVFVSATIDGLAAGATRTVELKGTLQNTGSYSVVLVVDLNNQVNEGTGEGNNSTYSFNYRIDRSTLSSGTVTVSNGGTADFDSNGADISWTPSNISAQGGAGLGTIATTFDQVHYDLINPSTTTSTSVTVTSGSILGIITSGGKRGVLRVDSINGDQVTISYRIYNN